MKQEFSAIQTYFLQGGSSTKLTKTWKKIHEEHGVGSTSHPVGGSPAIILSEADRKYLQKWIKDETGVDPFSKEQLPTSRIQAAGKGRNEKTSQRRVFAEMIRVARAGGSAINTLNGTAMAPPRCYVNIEGDSLILKDEMLITLENGELIREWDALTLPPALSNALFVYRGHDKEAAVLKSLVKKDPPKLNVGFYDFDPAGILMGLSNEHDALLVPADISQWVKGNKDFEVMNQPNVYWQQTAQLNSAKFRANVKISELLDHIEKECIAVMQEHMLAKKIVLELVYLKN